MKSQFSKFIPSLLLLFFSGRDLRINCQSKNKKQARRKIISAFLHSSSPWWEERFAPFVQLKGRKETEIARFNWFEFNSCEHRTHMDTAFCSIRPRLSAWCKWVFFFCLAKFLIYAFGQTTNFRYVRCSGHKSQISRNRFLSFVAFGADVRSCAVTASLSWWMHVRRIKRDIFSHSFITT